MVAVGMPLSISAFRSDSPPLPLSPTKPQKATEQETVSIKKNKGAEDSRSNLVFEEVDL